MNEQALKQLIAQALGALKAGGQIGAKAADEIENSAKNPELKAALKQGSQTAAKWATQIDQALQEVGGTDVNENPVLMANDEVSKKIRDKAPDDFSRDLGIIAASQLSLHYWIASLGTLRAYAKRAGLSQIEQTMAQALEEANQSDKKMTDIAIQIMS